MERKDILVSAEELERQRSFEQKIKAMFTAREAHPLACVDTFGCQQNVADGQMIQGMLEEMGFTFTADPKEADVVILNKVDVLPYFDFDVDRFETYLRRRNPTCDVVRVSAKTGEGIDGLASWVRGRVEAWRG